MHTFQCGYPHQHFQAIAFGQLRQHAGGLIGLQIREHHGLDLRMFVADGVGDRARVHPFQTVYSHIATGDDAVHQAARAVLAQRLDQHVLDVALGAHAQTGLRVALVDELREHVFHALLTDALQAGHGHAHALHFLRPHLLEHFGGVFLAHAHEQHGGALHRCHVLHHALAGQTIIFRHLHLSIA